LDADDSRDRVGVAVMSVSRERTVLVAQAGELVPGVRLIDAHANGLSDEMALRELARELSTAVSVPFTSRSYSFPLALVAWHTTPVGCDIERIASCDQTFADSIRTPAERAAAMAEEARPENTDCENADRDRRITSLWSSKEALAKALGDALDYDPRRLEGPEGWPEGRSGPWRASALDLAADHVAWVCWREGGD
jgi:4'-phosphopantetheinyl transferase superfamily